MTFLRKFIFFSLLFLPCCPHFVPPCASDGDGLLGILRGRPARMEHHASRLRREDAALQQESLQHGDMVFVNVVDTYRNVPSKLLQFYKWYAKS